MKTYFIKSSLLFLGLLSSGMWANNYTEIACTITPRTNFAETMSHPHIPGHQLRGAQGTQPTVSSNNWSGFAAATNLNTPTHNTVTAVSASWIVPTINTSRTNGYSSYWVGIDGYTSSTVEQIGTEHDCSSGRAVHSAWFEMYPGGSFTINNFPLNPGDVISASVVYSGNNIFTMRLINNTRNVSFTVPTGYTTLVGAQRSSAEWIVEAPFSNTILPLSNFGTAYMWGCIATINGITAPINNTSWQNDAIVMVTSSNNPVAKATPSTILPDNGSFFVTWSHQ